MKSKHLWGLGGFIAGTFFGAKVLHLLKLR
jgi:hypothetical protein